MPNTVLCVLAMYSQHTDFLGVSDVVSVVLALGEMFNALQAGKRYIIFK